MRSVQCRMARAALSWSTQDLAANAGVGVNTVNRFEAGQDARISSVDKMRVALESAGVIFVEENGEGPGVAAGGSRAQPKLEVYHRTALLLSILQAGGLHEHGRIRAGHCRWRRIRTAAHGPGSPSPSAPSDFQAKDATDPDEATRQDCQAKSTARSSRTKRW